jgi:hypothetical protein
MKPPADGWDPEEVETLAPFQQELAAIRERHAQFSEHDEARLLRRIQTDARRKPARASIFWTQPWLLAAASVVIIAGAAYLLRDRWTPAPASTTPAPDTTVVKSAPPPAPEFVLALAKPDLKVSPAALTYRSAAAENPLLADLKPAFDAYRVNDYATAEREFTSLASRYPKAVEVFFYQGVSRLFLSDVTGAIASLTAAGRIADDAFAWDIEWYRAVAEERAGNPAAARDRLSGLCRRPDTRAPQACELVTKLPAGK